MQSKSEVTSSGNPAKKHPCLSTNDPCDWELTYLECHRKLEAQRKISAKLLAALEAARPFVGCGELSGHTDNCIFRTIDAAIRKAKEGQ